MKVNRHFVSFNKKRLMILSVIFSIIFFVTAVLVQNPGPPEGIRELELSSLKGEVPVYFSEGFADRAAYLQGLAEPASRYFQEPEIIGVKVHLNLAVLGPEDWARFTQLPYGIAHILPDPPTAVLAASSDNIIANSLIAYKEEVSEVTLKRLEELDIPFEEAAATFVDLLGFHEMGHIYADTYGCAPPWPEQKWLGELVATYLAYAYMKENQPKIAELWNIMSDHMANSVEAEHTTLVDFEKLYIGVGNANYGWYQARFNQKVEEIYERSGISFVHTLKKSLAENPETSKDDPFRLKELDAIFEGFTTWAKGPAGILK